MRTKNTDFTYRSITESKKATIIKLYNKSIEIELTNEKEHATIVATDRFGIVPPKKYELDADIDYHDLWFMCRYIDNQFADEREAYYETNAGAVD